MNRGRTLALAVLLVGLMLPGMAAARCDVTYRVKAGDTLFSIAEMHYGDRERWTLLRQANRAKLGPGSEVEAGTEIHIPCRVAAPAGGSDGPGEDFAQLTLVTGDDYAPFSDRNWPENGLATELVTAAMEQSPASVPFTIAWEEDWSRHLYPLLAEQDHDMGFPWVRPDCEATPEADKCRDFHWSEPLMDLPIMLFVKAGGGVTYESDADVEGMTLCRPAGFFTHDLDRADRRWLADGKITLLQPETPEDCFEEVMAGHADAAVFNVFLGGTKIVQMGLRGKIVPLETPLSRETLHVVVARTHWRGTVHLYRINSGLAALRASGRYDRIVARHLETFWGQLE
ncbi:transporter substrate-binding domain-containing protein [Roseovarius sp. SCSIO 43702]|uniref:LysM peptidoglycan-binding domain-containing protein n=1 Tax=Roseovarius sp. SCSIO 43702 TaxID=2823043 RepID=UPI001C73B675|nr:transporter substrate-binding domain-containing protein [Roseovarius sp. SCSIO 43702]QYX57440.1 transporter substrate-binding domain-containing protein [Roseovarius sp. SCSIO 43702]